MGKSILLYIFVFLLLILFFVGSLTLSNVLPEKRIANNIKESVEYLEKEGEYPRFFSLDDSSRLDNWTDATMLNIALFSGAEQTPLKSSLEGSFYRDEEYEVTKTRPIAWLKDAALDESIKANTPYSRYWHGYLIYLRPMLMVMNLAEIRVFNAYIFYILLFVCVLLISKKCGYLTAFALILTVIMLNITIIPMCLQYSGVFIIMFLSIIVLLSMKNSRMPIAFVFFVIGCITMFFDFYTYPVLTICIPVSIVLIRDYKANTDIKFAKIMKIPGKCLAGWFIGYALTWGSKLLLSTVFLGQGELFKTFDAVAYWFSDSVKGIDVENGIWLTSIKLCLEQIVNKPFIIFSGIAIIILLLIFIFFKKPIKKMQLSASLLLISAIPFIWYVVAANPTAIHYWFQYRGLGSAIFGLLCAMIFSIDGQKFVGYINNKRTNRNNRKLDITQ